jgi:succinyl-diaminopimelate desuccinylase
LIAGILEPAGFSVAIHDLSADRSNVVAMLEGGGAKDPLCFTGHLDTVPFGAAPWQFDPLAATRDGDKIYGRGTSDMKSGVAAMVVAALEIAKLKARAADLLLVFTVGEETGCDGARYLAGLKNVLPKAGALVVGEPTGNVPLIGHRGALWLKAAFKGVTAHGSMPELGDNAVLKASSSGRSFDQYRFAPWRDECQFRARCGPGRDRHPDHSRPVQRGDPQGSHGRARRRGRGLEDRRCRRRRQQPAE